MAARKGRCLRCLVGGYTTGTAPDGRPLFTCTACGFSWTCGADGGQFVMKAREEVQRE